VGIKGLEEYLERVGISTGKMAREAATAALAITKFILAGSLLRIDVTMAPDTPLVRTTSTNKPEEHRLLTATVGFKTGDAQIVNCFRIMLNAVGQDFDLPNDGVAPDVPVTWTIIRGGALPMGSDPFVEWAAEKLQPSGKTMTTEVPTDALGQSKIMISGAPQRTPVPKGARPVWKRIAMVELTVPLKPVDLIGDMIAAAKSKIGLNAIEIILEILSRMSILTKNFEFVVLDHQTEFFLDVVWRFFSSQQVLNYNSEGRASVLLHFSEETGYTGEAPLNYKTEPARPPGACELTIQSEGTSSIVVAPGLLGRGLIDLDTGVIDFLLRPITEKMNSGTVNFSFEGCTDQSPERLEALKSIPIDVWHEGMYPAVTTHPEDGEWTITVDEPIVAQKVVKIEGNRVLWLISLALRRQAEPK
jgi:hypothetical protein